MKKIIFLPLLLSIALFSVNAQSLNKNYIDYIERYKELAIANQKEFKIPASITLAQALLESAAGQSRLALQANNHFGIKCGSSWNGPSIRHDDDRRGECFRQYDSPKGSYDDHARFLSTRERYSALFTLNINDYEAWAWGLSKAGYATSKDYAPRLIKIINDYSLTRYDDPFANKEMKGLLSFLQPTPKEDASTSVSIEQRDIHYFANRPFIIVRQGDNIASIALDVHKKASTLRSYNELPNDAEPAPGTKLFLAKKSKRAPVPYFQHTLEAGESLYDVAQLYGITLKALYKLNRLAPSHIPAVGQVIRLR